METFFSSGERIRLLNFFLKHPDREIKIRETAKKLNVSPAFVSKTTSALKKDRMVIKNKINTQNPLTRATKFFLNIKLLDDVGLVNKIRLIFPQCLGVGLYGSWSTGYNDSESDLDLWLKSEEKETDEKILKIRRLAKSELNLEANVLVLNKKRIQELRKKDFVFYYSLVNSFLLWGEPID